jgi:hypothetical protein
VLWFPRWGERPADSDADAVLVRRVEIISGVACLCALVAGLAQCVRPAAAASVASPSSLAPSLRATRSVLLGVSAPTARGGLDELDRFGVTVSKPAALANVYVSFASAHFDAGLADQIWRRGAVPMVTWLPVRDGSHGPDQPEFTLRQLRAGAHDGYIRTWAAGAAAWGHPLLLRFAPEMNEPGNAWSANVNGNSARDFRLAWRRVHDLFAQVGASNVAWVWSPNVLTPGSPPLASLYPGDRYVDWIGIDGYNWGTSQRRSHWQSFAQVFGPTLQAVRALTKKPLMLTEIGSSESGGSKAAWIRDFFVQLRRNPDILAFVWFDFDKETDWRVDSSATSRAAFTIGVADSRVLGAGALRRDG